MDELAKILGVLLKKVSYQPFLEGTIDCMDMEKNISLQALHGYMPFIAIQKQKYDGGSRSSFGGT